MSLTVDYWLSYDGRQLLLTASEFLENRNEVSAGELKRFRLMFPSVESARITEAINFASLMLKARKNNKLPSEIWLFTRETYEQATATNIAIHHAARFADCAKTAEICTGAGCDTFALSRIASRIDTFEANEYIASLARTNFLLNHVKNVQVITEKAEKAFAENKLKYDGIWADPARRNELRRVGGSPNEYSPSLDWLMTIKSASIIGIKISPVVNLQLPPGWVREWIGTRKECREQVLWYGTDVKDGTVWLADEQIAWSPIEKIHAEISIAERIIAGGYIIEPCATLIRSGFISSWFAERSIELLDTSIAYGFSNEKQEKTPFASVFEVISTVEFSYKNLQSTINALKLTADTEIKKRGFPEEPDAVRRKLYFTFSGEAGVIILTRYRGKRIAVFCRRVR